jgi:Raf kinase inhibitor-like YbhB/YbcL family protein
MTGIRLRSPAFDDHEVIPARHAHDRDNISPALQWSGVPAAASELLLLCEDPDAPGGPFLHWLVTGIDPASGGVDAGRIPPGGREWRNDFGETGWAGPQPPVGDKPHRYSFRLYALPRSIRLPAEPTAEDIHRLVEDSALAHASLVGLYQR